MIVNSNLCPDTSKVQFQIKDRSDVLCTVCILHGTMRSKNRSVELIVSKQLYLVLMNNIT